MWLFHERRSVPGVVQHLRAAPRSVRLWLKGFNALGPAGFVSAARPG